MMVITEYGREKVPNPYNVDARSGKIQLMSFYFTPRPLIYFTNLLTGASLCPTATDHAVAARIFSKHGYFLQIEFFQRSRAPNAASSC